MNYINLYAVHSSIMTVQDKEIESENAEQTSLWIMSGLLLDINSFFFSNFATLVENNTDRQI